MHRIDARETFAMTVPIFSPTIQLDFAKKDVNSMSACYLFDDLKRETLRCIELHFDVTASR